jgi:serine/threonine-protein kinase
MYCTMELVDGESLTQRFEQRRKLPVGEAVAIVCAVCEGLATAHAAHVMHRDIKPDNILLANDGRVVLADFGVAAAGVEGTGEISGTPAYMAPEQARGEPATPASDVYAVAIVLYELVTGRRAFAGEISTVLSAKQTLDRVVPQDGEVPPELADVIAKATARDPAQRIASAAALRTALQPWARVGRAATQPHRVPVTTTSDLATVIVLAPRGVNHPQMYLAQAVHEEVLVRLGRMPRVRVLARVGDVIETDVIGVCIDLEDTLSAKITPPHGETAILQLPLSVERVEEAAEAIAAAVAAVARERDGIPSEAADLLLRARYLIAIDFTKVPEALELLERAQVIAPGDPRIAASLMITRVRYAFFRPEENAGAIAETATRARATVAAHPDRADAQLAAGHVELAIGDPIAAARHFRAAIRNAPHLAEAHEQLGRMLLEAGYIEAAVSRLEEAIAISPNLRTAQWEIARAFALEGRWADHDRYVAELLESQLDRPLARSRYAWWRRDVAALEAMRSQLSAMGRQLWPGMMGMMFATFIEGKWAEVRDRVVAIANTAVESNRRVSFVSQLVCEAAAYAGDVDTCIVVLVRAIDKGLFDLHWLDRCPSLEIARQDSRFAPLRALVKVRADAILDALYGDHQAVSATQIAP